MAALQATVTAIPDEGPSPLTVYFSVYATGGTPPYTYDWKFGDNTPDAFTQTTTHTYASGTFNAQVTVTDSVGTRFVSNPIPITVSPSIPPVTVSVSQTQACVADAPGSLTPIISPPDLEALEAGAALEVLPTGRYYDRCLGEYVSTGSSLYGTGSETVPGTTYVTFTLLEA